MSESAELIREQGNGEPRVSRSALIEPGMSSFYEGAGFECEEIAGVDSVVELERIMRADIQAKVASNTIVRTKVQLPMSFCFARERHERIHGFVRYSAQRTRWAERHADATQIASSFIYRYLAKESRRKLSILLFRQDLIGPFRSKAIELIEHAFVARNPDALQDTLISKKSLSERSFLILSCGAHVEGAHGSFGDGVGRARDKMIEEPAPRQFG